VKNNGPFIQYSDSFPAISHCVTVGIVGPDHPALAHVVVGVTRRQIVQIDDERPRRGYDPSIDFDAELPLWKEIELTCKLLERPRLEVRVGAPVHALHIPEIRLLQLPDDDPALFTS